MVRKKKKPATTLWQKWHIDWVPGSFKRRVRNYFKKYPVISASVFFFTRLPAYFSGLSTRRDASVKFVIITQGRTGSSLLVDLLNSHPEIHCDPEILNYRILFPRLFLEGRSRLCRTNVYGFKLKLNHLIHSQGIKHPQAFIHLLHENGWKFVHLTRNNLLRQTVSWYVARARGNAEFRGSGRLLELEQITVDCDDLLRRLEERERLLEVESEMLEGVACLKLGYEAHLLHGNRHQETLNRVFRFLNLLSVPVQTDLQKIVTKPLSDVISNYHEVVHTVGCTKYARFLPNQSVVVHDR